MRILVTSAVLTIVLTVFAALIGLANMHYVWGLTPKSITAFWLFTALNAVIGLVTPFITARVLDVVENHE